MKNMRHIILPTVLALTLPLAGCALADQAEPASEAPAAAATAAAESRPEAAQLAASDLGADRAPAPRKLIQNAELGVEVDNYEKARREIDAELARLGGYVGKAEVQHRDGAVSQARLTLRVPSERLHDFLASAAGQGKVMQENLKAEDITDSYYDMKARLDNARRLETRLVGLMTERAKGMKDLLELEREIARVREEIERYEGKMRLWDQQVAMSTVELSLYTRQVYVASTPTTFGEKASDALGSSWGALVAFGQGLVLAATMILPWLLPLALFGLVVRRIWRRWRRRHSAFAAPGPLPSPARPDMPGEANDDAMAPA